MRGFARTAVAVLLAGLAPGAALAAKPANEPGPKKDKGPKIAVETPGKGHGAGHGNGSQHGHGHVKAETEGAPPAEPQSAAPAPPPEVEKAEGPPKAAEQQTAVPAAKTADRAADPPRTARGKVALCHATGSATNPFVLIVVSVNATTGNGHGRHAEDLIPADEGRCGRVGPAPDPEPDPDPEQPGPGGGGDGEKPTPAPKHDPDPAPAGAGGGRPVLGSQPVVPAEAASPIKAELPFTGLPIAFLALIGVTAVGTGVLLRRKGRPAGSTTRPASR
jgi:hypothetical protein